MPHPTRPEAPWPFLLAYAALAALFALSGYRTLRNLEKKTALTLRDPFRRYFVNWPWGLGKDPARTVRRGLRWRGFFTVVIGTTLCCLATAELVQRAVRWLQESPR